MPAVLNYDESIDPKNTNLEVEQFDIVSEFVSSSKPPYNDEKPKNED